MRARLVVFVGLLIGLASAPLGNPWSVALGCVAYLVIVLPVARICLWKGKIRSGGRRS